MLNSRNFIITASSLTVVINSRPYIIDNTHTNFDDIKDGIKNGVSDEVLIKLIDVSTAINEYAQGRITVKNGQVFYKDIEVKNTLTERILVMMREGFDINSMCKFMDNLYSNPSRTAVNELYLFLEACNLPITEDGHFLAYKKVKHNYMDIYSGTFDNSIGKICEMERNEVDDNRNNTCSAGLHFASYSYMAHYGGTGNDDRIVIVKINPADVVSIPSDYNNAKGRCWKYEVVNEVPNDGKTEIKGNCISDDKVYQETKKTVEVVPERVTTNKLVEGSELYKTVKKTLTNHLYSGSLTLDDLVDVCLNYGMEYIEDMIDGENFNQIANIVRDEIISIEIDAEEFLDSIESRLVKTATIKDTKVDFNSYVYIDQNSDKTPLDQIKESRINQYINKFGGDKNLLKNVPNVDLRWCLENNTPYIKKENTNTTIKLELPINTPVVDIKKFEQKLQLIEKELKRPNNSVWNTLVNNYSNNIPDASRMRQLNDYKGMIKQLKQLIINGIITDIEIS